MHGISACWPDLHQSQRHRRQEDAVSHRHLRNQVTILGKSRPTWTSLSLRLNLGRVVTPSDVALRCQGETRHRVRDRRSGVLETTKQPPPNTGAWLANGLIVLWLRNSNIWSPPPPLGLRDHSHWIFKVYEWTRARTMNDHHHVTEGEGERAANHPHFRLRLRTRIHRPCVGW